MSKMDEIKAAVATLSFEEQAALQAWLEELAEQRFDEQIESDEKAGKLDKLFEAALARHAAGKSIKLP